MLRGSRRRRLSAVLGAVGGSLTLALTAVAVGPTAASATTAGTGIVQRSGTQLVLDGSPYRFTGFQIGLGASPQHPLCTTFSDEAVGASLTRARQSSGANAVRVWMFQGYGGPADWNRFDLIFSEARKAGVRVVATLTNQWGECEPRRSDGSLVAKRLPWYQSGYRTPDPGYALSYRDFVRAMAERYKAEPALLAWQLVNEAEAPKADGTCDEASGAAALRAFSDDAVSVIRATGDAHLVGLGSMGSGQCGLSGSANYRTVHAGGLDMCEYHDYTPTSAVPGDAWNGLATRISDCTAVGKPLFVGEAGIPSGVQVDGSTGATTSETLARRAALFEDKLSRQTAAGVVGFVVWQRAAANGDGFTVFDGDPVEAVLLRHAPAADPQPTTVLPTASPTASPTTSPSPSPTATATPTLLTKVLSGSTGATGRTTLRLTTGAGQVGLTVRGLSLRTVKVVVRDASGTVRGSASGTLPVTLRATVPAGAQSLTVSGPRRLLFTIEATYVAP